MKKSILIAIIIMLLATIAYAEPGKVDRAGSRADATITATYAHHENHKCMFFSSVFNEPSLSTGGAITFLVNTPGEPINDHALLIMRSSAEANLKVYEAPTVSAVGTAMDETIHNRNCSNVAGTEITRAPTVTDLGVELPGFEQHIGAGQTRGGESQGISELIMKPNTLYIVNATSEANSNDVTLGDFWYEDAGDAP